MIGFVQCGNLTAFLKPAFAASGPTLRYDRRDPRWPAIAAALAALREKGRCAVRIVDADCAAGGLLLEALGSARRLGFTAIEGRGIDGSPALIGRARAAASRAPDLAIGVEFEVADVATALEAECDLPADIILWPGSGLSDQVAVDDLLHRAGNLVIDGSHAGLSQASLR